VEAVRAACPGLPVGVSTGAWIEPDPVRRLDLIRSWSLPPDFVSVNLSETGAPDLIRALLGLGLGVEAGLSTETGARVLLAEGLASPCLRILVEPRRDDGPDAVAAAAAIDAVLDADGVTVERVHHSYGQATWPVIRAALARGWNVRAGLEDSLTLPDGSAARDNAELVKAAIDLERDPLAA
jgi:uncharacterized protein (DUF849 family)